MMHSKVTRKIKDFMKGDSPLLQFTFKKGSDDIQVEKTDLLKHYTVMSGSFNPVHMGHFNLARAA